MWKFIFAAALLATVIVAGLLLLDQPKRDKISANAVLPVLQDDSSGYARAIEPYEWQFPADHGAHPAFQTEWWYYTGNLATDSGQRFGYQFTIFRRAIAPTASTSASEWRTNQIYMAHFTITDVDNEQFYQFQRFSRGGAGLAGATAEPQYRVWLDNWSVFALDGEAANTRIQAAEEAVGVDFGLVQAKPPALQSDQGLSPKSAEPGNASYYYSLSRLLTTGTLTIDGNSYNVSGTSWMDHEFSTSALGPNAQGWDWFGLHLDDGRDLMLGQIRLVEGSIDPVFGGLLIYPDGSAKRLLSQNFRIDVTGTWTSPHTGTTYPAGWDIIVDTGESQPLHLTLMPLIADQELTEGIVYWEGAVRITGDAAGYGYAELTGYQSAMRGRF